MIFLFLCRLLSWLLIQIFLFFDVELPSRESISSRDETTHETSARKNAQYMLDYMSGDAYDSIEISEIISK